MERFGTLRVHQLHRPHSGSWGSHTRDRGRQKNSLEPRRDGKRGGVRVIYYFHDESIPLFLLTVYPKSRKENLSAAELKAIKQLASTLRSIYGKQ